MLTSTHSFDMPTPDFSNTNEQWIHLFPSGQFAGRDGRGPYVIKNINQLIENTNTRIGSGLIPIDYEHQIDLAIKNGQPAPAAGWIKELKAENNGLWALVEWTKRAIEHISEKEYRYISPTFHYLKKTGEVKILLRAAITNNPNLELTALATAQDQDTEQENRSFITELKGILELAPESNRQDIIEKIQYLLSKALPREENSSGHNYVSTEEFQIAIASLQSEKQEQDKKYTKMLVEGAIQSGKIPPSLKDWAVSLCKEDASSFESFSHKMPEAFSYLSKSVCPKKYESAEMSANSLTTEQKGICEVLGHSPDQFISTMNNIIERD